jgi:hypothetical protein
MTARVLLWHLDGRLPDLALMRLAAYHRAPGDVVELRRVSNPSAQDEAAWHAARGAPRRLRDRRVSLPLCGGDGP